ncbi:MAG: hypothetical protein KJS97_00235 [Alphaproteobacteria bacterium]|nr:hypothetical protein [Alphaproteobacteria bacterium]
MRIIVSAGLAAAVLVASCGPQKREEAPAATPGPIALPASTGLSLEGRITATGAEPGWRLDVAPEGLVFSHPGGVVKAAYSAPQMDEAGAMLSSGKIKARLLVQPCDEASGATAPMRARVDVQGVGTFDGCAYARWDNGLEALIPAIDACLGATTEPSPVIFAAPLASGTLVRLRGVEDGERYDCVVDPSGLASILQSEAPIAPGERDPTFTRAPTDTPPRACEAVEIKGKDGVLLGWETHGQTC